jgi:hypothetical protein
MARVARIVSPSSGASSARVDSRGGGREDWDWGGETKGRHQRDQSERVGDVVWMCREDSGSMDMVPPNALKETVP